MTDSDFNSSSTSSNLVVSAHSPVVDLTRERRSKSHHDYSTSGRATEESVVHASPLTAITTLGHALRVPVSDQYGTMVGLAERSPYSFPLVNPRPLSRHGRQRRVHPFQDRQMTKTS